jgi:2-haloacid dehalogenase
LSVRALVFDVFGTLVDWRTSVAREVRALLGPRVADPEGFADAWRALYQPSMEAVRGGARPYVPLDVLHRESLDRVLAQRGLDDAGEALRVELNQAWHRLDAWPDVAPGLSALRARYRIAPCSNGPIALMVNLARRNGLAWDAIAGAELARDYKPRPAVYLAACAAFDCRPDEVAMVACHSADLAAAAAAGLRTAHVARPGERGPGRGEDAPAVAVDWQARDLVDLARQLA